MILFIENHKDSIRTLLELINEFTAKLQDTKLREKSLAFLYTNNKKIRKRN